MTTAVAPPPRTAGARHFAWRYSPEGARAATAALLTIEHEITASTDAKLDHAVAHARLAWWHEECERLHAAQPAHPATRAVRDACYALGVAPPDLTELPAIAASWLADATLARPALAADIDARATRWARALFRPLAQLAVAATPGAIAHATDQAAIERLGTALHAHETVGDAATGEVLRAALRALPAPLAPALRGLVVWSTLALAPAAGATSVSFVEDWRAWRAARGALRTNPRNPR